MPRVAPSAAEIGIYTWGSKVPRSYTPIASYIVDVAGLRDPQSNRGFKKRHPHGCAGEIQEYVKEDPRYPAISDMVKMLAHLHLRSDAQDGKWLTIALVDFHGRWIAPAVAELVSDELSSAGFRVSCFHYDLPETNK